MTNKVRLGFVGANIRSKWASVSHFPALRASPDVELTAVCTTNPVSAEEARKAFGAKLAFSDYREMVVSPEIDAVVVVVRVPSHYDPTIAAIKAGKHVYTEWPLGRTTAEAEEMTTLARSKGVQAAVGLQSRVSPALLYMKELIEAGYVGKVLTCHVSVVRHCPLEHPANRTWFRDVTLGANPLTIVGGHVVDALRFVAGDFAHIGSMVTSQIKEWYEIETKKMVDVTSPDNVLLHGQLVSGAVASVHVATTPWAPSGYRMEIYGTEGTLIVSSKVASNHGEQGEMLRLQGTQRSQELRDLAIPERFTCVPPEFPLGTPFPVGQMYALFAQAVRTGQTPTRLPTFETALEMHRILDVIRQGSETGRMLAVPRSASIRS